MNITECAQSSHLLDFFLFYFFFFKIFSNIKIFSKFSQALLASRQVIDIQMESKIDNKVLAFIKFTLHSTLGEVDHD